MTRKHPWPSLPYGKKRTPQHMRTHACAERHPSDDWPPGRTQSRHNHCHTPPNSRTRFCAAHRCRNRLTRQSRADHTLAAVAEGSGRKGLLVVEREGLALWIAGQTFRYHPNMATMRIRALSQHNNDGFVDALQLTAGARVLDCTCGLGADAIVAAHVVGPTGRVRTLESSALLARLVAHGMAHYALDTPPELVPAMRRIEALHADFATYLRQEADNAWDIVYFDPMFAETIDMAPGLDLVRRLATPGGPSADDVQEARRVAQRWVVMKDRLPGRSLAELGFTKNKISRRICYGTIDAL